MNLSIPINWQNDFLEKVNTKKVSDVYGKLEKDIIGGGRPSSISVSITKRILKNYVIKIHKKILILKLIKTIRK